MRRKLFFSVLIFTSLLLAAISAQPQGGADATSGATAQPRREGNYGPPSGIPSGMPQGGQPDSASGKRFGPPPLLPRIDLSKSLYWCEISPSEDISQVLACPERFKKLEDTKNMNLYRAMGKKEGYALVKADFVVPENYRGHTLGCLISYIHFAEIAYVNGAMVGLYGLFPPISISSFYVSHQYPVPDTLLNYGGNNTICFKVYCHGKSSFSGKIFISEMKDITQTEHKINFWNSFVYLFFAGLLVATFVVFMIFYFARKEKKEYISFAILNLFTAMFVSFFFAGSVPIYEFLNIPYNIFTKLFLCCSVYILVYHYVNFHFNFLDCKEITLSKIIRHTLLVIKIFLTFFIQSYTALMKLTSFMLAVSALEIFYAFILILYSFRRPEMKHNARLLLYGIVPLGFSFGLDYILRVIIRIPAIPFVSMFGWIIEIFLFVIVFAVRFERLVKSNEYLTTQLKKEVDLQTKNLTIANENLAKEIFRANQDLEMAAIVQRKYFPSPNKKFKGWDMAISYNPLSNVSGDLYDYYFKDEELTGFSLFDVSGHGLSASLVTMLAKNIIASSFERGLKRKSSVSEMLLSINYRINHEKGTIDNYLTGLLLKISEPDDKDSCLVQFANAGHPHPVLYSKKNKSAAEVKYSGTQKHYGAIGLLGIDVSFPETSFTAENGDILILYTDGLTESMNENMEAFGLQRVLDVVSKNAEYGAAKIMENLIYELENFTDSVPKTDDITIVILKKEESSLYEDSDESQDSLELLEPDGLEPVEPANETETEEPANETPSDPEV